MGFDLSFGQKSSRTSNCRIAACIAKFFLSLLLRASFDLDWVGCGHHEISVIWPSPSGSASRLNLSTAVGKAKACCPDGCNRRANFRLGRYGVGSKTDEKNGEIQGPYCTYALTRSWAHTKLCLRFFEVSHYRRYSRLKMADLTISKQGGPPKVSSISSDIDAAGINSLTENEKPFQSWEKSGTWAATQRVLRNVQRYVWDDPDKPKEEKKFLFKLDFF